MAGIAFVCWGGELGAEFEGRVEETGIGPWGQLEYFAVTLVAPKEVVKMGLPASFRSRWVFENRTEESLESFLQSLELPSAMEASILDRSLWRWEGKSIILNAPRVVVRELPVSARRALYQELSKVAANLHQCEPEIMLGNGAREWLKDFEISESVLQFIDSSSYERGGFRVFADTLEALAMCGSDAERLRLLRGFSRTSTLMAKLRLRSASPEALTEYWGTGPRRKSTLPLLESMLRIEGLNLIDLLNLLPAHVRKIVFTYPDPLSARSGYLPDCHWSSLNFFNGEPLESLADPVNATAYVMEHFEKIGPPYRLGDVLFFTDTQTGNAYHSCAFIADDIVFTKNGRSPLQPWVLMKLEEIKKLYDLHFHTEVTAYRRRLE